MECCHIAENVFDILRKGERQVDSELMDVILEALDAVNGMFSEVRERAPITAATPELLAALARLAEPAAEAPAVQAAPEPVVEAEADVTDSEFEQLLDSLNAVKAEAEAPAAPAPAATPTSEDITDAEFESLLDQLHGKGQFAADAVAPAAPPAAPAASAGTDITDDEFEALLDQLHGKGTFVAEALPQVAATATAPAAPAAKAEPAEPAGDGLISDNEFEALLDELHGKGKFTEVAPAAAPRLQRSLRPRRLPPKLRRRPPNPRLQRLRRQPRRVLHQRRSPTNLPVKPKPPCAWTPRAWTTS